MGVRWVVAVALVASLCACGDPAVDSVTAESEGAPFAGDLSGGRGAERALECAGATYRRGVGDLDDGLEEVGESPGAALDHWLDPEGWLGQLPTTGYALEREDDGRALLSFDSDERTVVAFVMRDGLTDYRDDEGWGVESYALCDPAEWPVETTDALGIGVWTDASGTPVPTTVVQSFRGPEHCGWQGMTFLSLGTDGAGGEFYGTPDAELRKLLITTYAAHVELPVDARDTGYRRDGRELWLAADGSAAYLVSDDGDAERWPAPKRGPIRCA